MFLCTWYMSVSYLPPQPTLQGSPEGCRLQQRLPEQLWDLTSHLSVKWNGFINTTQSIFRKENVKTFILVLVAQSVFVGVLSVFMPDIWSSKGVTEKQAALWE